MYIYIYVHIYICTYIYIYIYISIPVAARPKAWVCGRSLNVIAGSNPAGRHEYLSPVSVVCCQVEVSASSRGRSPSERGVPECESEVSTMRPWPQIPKAEP